VKWSVNSCFCLRVNFGVWLNKVKMVVPSCQQSSSVLQLLIKFDTTQYTIHSITMNQEILSKKALLAPFFLWLHESQVYARVGTTPVSRSLAIDPLCYPDTKSVKIETANGQMLFMKEVKAFSLDDVNVALGGTATQSSTQWPASNAIDGLDWSISQTAGGELNPWWQVDLASSSILKSLDITNLDWDFCRLSGATVTLSNELGEVVDTKTLGSTCGESVSIDLSMCTSPPSTPTASPVVTDTQVVSAPSSTDADSFCYPDTKSVKIETANKELLNILEVKAVSLDDVNVALSGTASQSSTYMAGMTRLASYAIDGNEATFAHTDIGDQNPWWQVDLASSSALKSVDIKNRHCNTDPICLCRLSGATVFLTNELGEVVDSKTLGNTCGVSDISIDLSMCSPPSTPTTSPPSTPTASPPSNNAGDAPVITFDDVVVTSGDSFQITFNNPLDQTEIYAAVVSNSYCNADNSHVEVNSDTPNVFVGSSSATILQSISELITAEQKNTGSVFLEFCLRADVRTAGFPSSLLATKMSLGITVNFEDESGIVLNDPSSGFKIEVTTAEFVETTVDYTSKRGVSISAILGECAAPGNAGPYGIGSTLKFCVKSVDSDVIISSLNDVSFTDLEGNPILGITDASGEPSYVTAINGIDSKEVDVSTMMATTIFDQGYGGTTINVQGTVSVTYVDQASHRRRQLETEETKPFAFKIAVGETAVQQESTYYTNSAKPAGNPIVWVFAAVGMVVVSVLI
jgi:hypothetical protein